jgi:N-formylglutamate amidohydrolase
MDRLLKDILRSLLPKTEYLVGDMGLRGIVISAPHGGGVRPVNIPVRRYGKMGKDIYTRKVIETIVENLEPKPYYLYSDLHRSRLDLNRPLSEAAQGNKKAEEIWRAWNLLLESFIADAVKKYGKVLYIDLHSQSTTDSFHLGYNLTTREYRLIRQGKRIFGKSTMAGLVENQFDILFEQGSFYHSLINMGYNVHNPESDKTYFNGGFNIAEHSGEHVGAIQIELPAAILRKDAEKVGKDVATTIENFSGKFLR